MININNNSIEDGILSEGKLIIGKSEIDDSSIFVNDNGTRGSAISGAIVKGYINNTGKNNRISIESAFGATATGLILDSSNSYISSRGDGAVVSGVVENSNNGHIDANGAGSFINGYVNNDGIIYINNAANGAGASGYATNKGCIIVGDSGAHAEGYANDGLIYAFGEGAHAEGYADEGSIYAFGDGAHAEGKANDEGSIYAFGAGSHAEGHSTSALGIGSHAEGLFTTAGETIEYISNLTYHNIESGQNSIFYADGSSTGLLNTGDIIKIKNSYVKITTFSVSGNTNNYLYKITVNRELNNDEILWIDGLADESQKLILLTNSASGDAAHAEGYNTFAFGEGAHAEGNNTQAFGRYSHAEGNINSLASLHNTNVHVYSIVSNNNFLLRERGSGSNFNIGDFISYNNLTFRITNINNDTIGVYPAIKININVNKTIYKFIIGSFGTASHTEGYNTIANASCSHAEGKYTITKNEAEHAQGLYNLSHDTSTIHSIGIGTSENNRRNAIEVLKDGSTYLYGVGNYDGSTLTNASTLQLVIKDITLSAGTNITIGSNNKINANGYTYNSNYNSFKIGYNTKVTGTYSYASGCDTLVYGTASYASGYNTKVIGENSYVGGNACIVAGYNTNIGIGITASGFYDGTYSISVSPDPTYTIKKNDILTINGRKFTVNSIGGNYIGFEEPLTGEDLNAAKTKIFGFADPVNYAIAYGDHTTAYKNHMVAIGKYNDSSNKYSGWVPLFCIGNGSGDEDEPATKFHNGFTVYNKTNIGPRDSRKVLVDIVGDVSCNGNVSCKAVTVTSTISCDTLNVTTGAYQTSDINLKDIISNDISLEKAYEVLDKCHTILYTLKGDESKKEQIGMIAQEIQEYFPEVISDSKDGTLSLDYSRLSVILFRLCKDLVKKNNEINERLNRIEEKLKLL